MQSRNYSIRFVLIFAIILFPSLILSQTEVLPMKFISTKHAKLLEELVEKQNFDIDFLRPLFEAVVIRAEIIDKFEKPAEKLPYYDYQKRFLENKLIERGKNYFQENQAALSQVEEDYGVSKEVIAAILGIETRFGEPGIEKYRVWDVLNTAYALYPRREAFYKSELIAFLTLCKEEGLNPLTINSSYAGAMGIPQFMPSSFLKFSVDGNGDRKRDLWSSREDIYASVANYLKQAGWEKDGPTYLPVKITGSPAEAQKLLEAGIRETMSVARASEMGIEIPESVSRDAKVSFAMYEPEKGKDVFIALFTNFRVITAYNFSVNYALVVSELSERLQ
mgnify:CR=1 FL=1